MVQEPRNINVLIIGSNRDTANIHEFLLARGYIVDAMNKAMAGSQLTAISMYDVVILDSNSSGGAEFCLRIRHSIDRYVPMLLLLARDSLESKLEGFHAGADDCMIKPVSLRELAARVKSLTKQISHIPTFRQLIDGTTQDSNMDVRTTLHTEKHIKLNSILLQLLLYLIQNPNRSIKREEFEYAVWKKQSLGTAEKLFAYTPGLYQVVNLVFDQFRTKRKRIHHADKISGD